MSTQAIYTQSDIDKIFWAGRKMANAIQKCHLKTEHRKQTDNAISEFNKAFIRLGKKASRKAATSRLG